MGVINVEPYVGTRCASQFLHTPLRTPNNIMSGRRRPRLAHGGRLGVNPQLLRLCSDVSGRRCTAERPAGHGRSFENGRPGWRNEDDGRVLLLQLWLHCQRSPIAVLWASRRQAGPLREQPSAPSCPRLRALSPRLRKWWRLLWRPWAGTAVCADGCLGVPAAIGMPGHSSRLLTSRQWPRPLPTPS